ISSPTSRTTTLVVDCSRRWASAASCSIICVALTKRATRIGSRSSAFADDLFRAGRLSPARFVERREDAIARLSRRRWARSATWQEPIRIALATRQGSKRHGRIARRCCFPHRGNARQLLAVLLMAFGARRKPCKKDTVLYIHRVELDWGGRKLPLETGRVARQADGAVLATYGET